IIHLFPKFLSQYQSISIIQDEEIPSTLVYVFNYLHHSFTRTEIEVRKHLKQTRLLSC
ncbi:unnamed protein product, partial [Brassica rapa subsp. trilocularis]